MYGRKVDIRMCICIYIYQELEELCHPPCYIGISSLCPTRRIFQVAFTVNVPLCLICRKFSLLFGEESLEQHKPGWKTI